jgi:hypothetical protein
MAEREGWLAAALAQVRGVEFDEAAVRARMMRPDSLLTAHSDRGRAGAPAERAVHPPPFPVPVFYTLDAAGFIALLQEPRAHTVAGYSLGLTENGSLIGGADQNWAKWPQDGARGWTPDTRMHVASLNKTAGMHAFQETPGDADFRQVRPRRSASAAPCCLGGPMRRGPGQRRRRCRAVA